MATRRTIWLGCVILALVLTSGSQAADTVIKGETFDTAEDAAANGWVEHNSRGGP